MKFWKTSASGTGYRNKSSSTLCCCFVIVSGDGAQQLSVAYSPIE